MCRFLIICWFIAPNQVLFWGPILDDILWYVFFSNISAKSPTFFDMTAQLKYIGLGRVSSHEPACFGSCGLFYTCLFFLSRIDPERPKNVWKCKINIETTFEKCQIFTKVYGDDWQKKSLLFFFSKAYYLLFLAKGKWQNVLFWGEKEGINNEQNRSSKSIQIS